MELALFILFLLFMVIVGLPVAYSIIIASVSYLILTGQDVALASEHLLSNTFNNFLLLSVPLFIFFANIMNASQVTEKLLAFCLAVVGRVRGGLGHVNVITSVIFSGMSGSAVADVAGIGKVIISMMNKSGSYSRGYAEAITAASSTIGPIIPPSIPMVLYALVSSSSIGYLFLGGIIPGLLMAVALMMINSFIAKRRNFAVEEGVPIRELPKRTYQAFPALIMPVILLYGIYGGVMTPTEAAAVASMYALMVAVFLYRSLSVKSFYNAMVESVHTSASTGLLICSALILNYIIVTENVPITIYEMFSSINISPIQFLLMINILILLLGFVLDASIIILVIIPLFIPIVKEMGIDLVHFGVVMVVNCMVGYITPPYGIVLLVINNITKTPIGVIMREIYPFLAGLVFILILLIFNPSLVLWLPKFFGYSG
ncbi:MAG: TRAP transporter large permease [Alphaproteobacteria bacterium]